MEINENTPLSKVDNHIGEMVEDIVSLDEVAADLYHYDEDNETWRYALKERAAFIAGATYRTQHPDPAMVDRILSYVAENIDEAIEEEYTNPRSQNVEPEYIGIKVDRDHIKSMRDDILKELSK